MERATEWVKEPEPVPRNKINEKNNERKEETHQPR